jgi:uncharacterized protein YkwD
MAGKMTTKKSVKKNPKCKVKKTNHRLAAVLSALLAAAQLFTGGLYINPSNSMAAQIPDAKEIIVKTNAFRSTNSLSALTESDQLDKAAEAKLADMQKNNYWNHTSPTGVQPWSFIEGVQYNYAYAGENLGKGFSTAEGVVNAWTESPKHRENLLNSNFTEIGIAVGSIPLDGKDNTVMVQMFGKPKTAPTQTSSFTTLVMGAKSEPALSFVNPVNNSKLAYFIIWGMLFMLIVFDGIELRRCGLHTSKKHMFEFRSALLINCFAFLLLFVNIVSLA